MRVEVLRQTPRQPPHRHPRRAGPAGGNAFVPPILAIAVTALLALDLAAGDGLWFEYTGTLGFALLGAHSLVLLADLFLRSADPPPDRRLLALSLTLLLALWFAILKTIFAGPWPT